MMTELWPAAAPTTCIHQLQVVHSCLTCSYIDDVCMASADSSRLCRLVMVVLHTLSA